MDRSRITKNVTKSLAAAALGGMFVGSIGFVGGCQKDAGTTMSTDAGKHSCAGKNACKGQGGCKTGDQGCKAKNSCKGHGGCTTM